MAIPLIVEDGSMKDGANTYATTAQADAYLAARGAEKWAELDDDGKTIALIRAADTLNSYNWKGVTAKPGRVMTWPRKGVAYADGTPVKEDEVPLQIVNAQCELAGAIVTNEADPLAPVDTTVGAVTSEKVDVIAVSYAEPDSNAYTGITGYPAVDGLLKQFLRGGSGRFGVVEVGRG